MKKVAIWIRKVIRIILWASIILLLIFGRKIDWDRIPYNADMILFGGIIFVYGLLGIVLNSILIGRSDLDYSKNSILGKSINVLITVIGLAITFYFSILQYNTFLN